MGLKFPLGIGLIVFAGMAYSCVGPKIKTVSTSPTDSLAKKAANLEESYQKDADYIQGLALIKENDCPSCHSAARKIVGPSYAAVASKYETNDKVVGMLVERIIAGSAGIWGQIPMTPHPRLSKEDAEQMVKYILLIDK